MRPFARLAVPLAFAFVAVPAFADDQTANTYQNLLTPVLSGNQTIIDQTIAYPAGTPNVTAAVVTIPVGGHTGWHTHAVPLFAYVMEGKLSVDYGTKGVKVLEPGTGILEAMDWPHNATNIGDVPVRILAVYMGAGDLPNATPVATSE
jgi:quercetin dioxygenase-like cupin family protein